jgi:8-oxo-dGTP pyrophosphatase MutT (NUDIX family)
VLLSLRENTGYEDGKWCLIAGHQEEGEAATEAMIREALEEIGIIINRRDLKPIHIMHRNTNREGIDIFFECDRWENTPENKEQDKSGGLKFFSLQELPDNMVEYVKEAIKSGMEGDCYSELGWKERAIAGVD